MGTKLSELDLTNPEFIANLLYDLFDAATLNRGAKYFKKGMVSRCSYDNETIEATISGSRSTPYFFSFEIFRADDDHNGYGIDGGCSCPVRYNCKHAAATLFFLLHRLTTQEHTITPSSSEAEKWAQKLTYEPKTTPALSEPGEIVYILNLTNPKKFTVTIGFSRHLASGGLGTPNNLSTESSKWSEHASAADAIILLHLKKEHSAANSPFDLYGINISLLLSEMTNSKRLFWSNPNTAPLKIAEPRKLDLEWEVQNDGTQTLKLLAENNAVILPTTPPWYVDSEQSECGPLISDVPDHFFPDLLDIPSVRPNEIQEMEHALDKYGLKTSLPNPEKIKIKKIKKTPKPCLEFFTASNNAFTKKEIPLIRVFFRYGERTIPFQSDQKAVYFRKKHTVNEIERNLEKENKKYESLIRHNELHPLSYFELHSIKEGEKGNIMVGQEHWSEEKIIEALGQIISYAKKENWEISFAPNFPYDWIEEENATWYTEIEDTKTDWFDLELGFEVDGEKHNLLPYLVNWIEKQPGKLNLSKIGETGITFQLSNGKCVSLPPEKTKKILETLLELFDGPNLIDDKLRLSRLRSPEILEMTQEENLDWRGAKGLKLQAEKIRSFEKIKEISPPENFFAQLRPYQQKGLNWLQFLLEFQMGGILADDMGLGKTIQALACLTLEKNSGRQKHPNLVIAPTSLMGNWESEAKKFAPDLKTLVIHGSERKKLFEQIPQCDIVFTTYPLLNRDSEHIFKHQYHILILDEAQIIKNPRTKAAKFCKEIAANHRLCLTGTPMENHLEELWSLFDFSNPGLLGPLSQFRKLFRTPIEKHNDTLRQTRLSQRIHPFLLRRTKKEVAKDLPPKTEIIKKIPLEGDQSDLYEAIRLSMHQKITRALATKGIGSSQIIILDALLKLRQVCCDPRLLKLDAAKNVKNSSKFSHLKEMLNELLGEKRKILIFSSFTTMLALIESHLQEKNISYSILTGKSTNRTESVEHFQSGKTQVFLISLKAGGVGLNLTAADTVILYDPWWNPAAENQAIDRAHRIGQDKPIFVYKLIAEKSVEEKILQLQEKKQSLVDKLLSESEKNSSSSITQEDLEVLFSPIDI